MQEMQETRVRSLGREDPLEEGVGNPLQYSCLKNATDRGAWWVMIHEVTKSWTWLTPGIVPSESKLTITDPSSQARFSPQACTPRPSQSMHWVFSLIWLRHMPVFSTLLSNICPYLPKFKNQEHFPSCVSPSLVASWKLAPVGKGQGSQG